MRIAIIDCGAGNLHSVQKAFAHVVGTQAEVTITTRPEALDAASHIVLPGVGTYADCMEGLLRPDGLREALEANVLQGGKPMLGICVGMQMLLERGHEFKVTEGLGWFKGEVKKLAPADTTLRIPHMGWNELQMKPHPLFAGLTGQQDVAPSPEPVSSRRSEDRSGEQRKDSHAYFVHSYHATGVQEEEILASVDYGGRVVACIGRGNIVATQFHPEKSQKLGLALIDNFVRM